MLVGDNPASTQYLNATLSACKKVGIKPYKYTLPERVSLNEILNIVHSINRDERINGLLALMPFPKRINSRRVINEIVPEKDIDGLGSLSAGRLAADESTFQIFQRGDYESLYKRESPTGVSSFLPCTPFGVIRLIEHCGLEIKGKHAVVIGKSLAVGKPLSLMFLAKEATVTVCHSRTADLPSVARSADILVAAVGRPQMVKGDWIKPGATVIDVGINRVQVEIDGETKNKLVGDVDYDEALKVAAAVTPVPGGVGPMTIVMLMANTLLSAERALA